MNRASDESANDVGGVGETLRPMEATDSDDVRNDDGDEVVDPPDHWSEADKVNDTAGEHESLDQKLAAERPEKTPQPSNPGAPINEDVELRADDQLDDINTDDHGTDEGQISGTPEDGDSIFPVIE